MVARNVTVPRGAGPAATGHPEPIVEPGDQVGRPVAYRPSGGQLDGQRHTVEPAADLLDVVMMRTRIVGSIGGERAGMEQLGTGGWIQWSHRQYLFGSYGEAFP